MIITNSDLDQEVVDSSVGDTFTATAWRGGQVVASGLKINSLSLKWDATTDQVQQGRCDIEIADPDGTLAPWSLGDPLGPGGSRLQLAWASGSSSIGVPLGMWRIKADKTLETWRAYNNGTAPIRVSGGGSVTMALEEDLTSTAFMSRIDGEAPTAGASAIAELRKLLADIGSVDATLAPADVNIPAGYVSWPESRVDAIDDILGFLGARSRTGGDSSLQIVPRAGVGPVWTIQGGPGGALIEAARSLSDTGVYNACTSKNATADGTTPIVQRAYLNVGPLRYGGPFGKVPVFHQAIATTPIGVLSDAQTFLATLSASGVADLMVSCMAHPALQVHDIVTVLAPTVAGDLPLNGRVVGKVWKTEDGVPSKSMSLVVRVSAEVLEMIADRVRRG